MDNVVESYQKVHSFEVKMFYKKCLKRIFVKKTTTKTIYRSRWRKIRLIISNQ